MDNLLLLRFELLVFLLSFSYCIYYMGERAYFSYFKIKKAIKKEDIKTVKTALNKVDLSKKEGNYKKGKFIQLSDEDQKKISEILKRVRVNSTKGYFDTAKGLIIEGLSIDKFNKDLNMELANIYEKEKNFINSEFIYNDLLEIHKNDFEIMKKLAYIYVRKNDLDSAYATYEKIHRKKMADEEVINMLSEITYDLKKHKDCVNYINQYLKFKPRDIVKLNMKAVCLEEARDFKDCIEIHKRILELQPYNTTSRDKMKELSKYS